MRPILIAGNWKMNMNRRLAAEWASKVGAKASPQDALRVTVCPSFPYLALLVDQLSGSGVSVGAQNIYFETDGAYTGEVSGDMLVDIGCEYVVLGHSERRHVMGETDPQIRRKVKAALVAGVSPILCVGELLEERDRDETNGVITAQIESGLAGVSPKDMTRIVIAYEPVWAIGTGRTASPEQAEEVHLAIRKSVAHLYDARIAESLVILYGGSAKPGNARSLLEQEDVDGLLVGGASLQADDFLAIIEAGRELALPA